MSIDVIYEKHHSKVAERNWLYRAIFMLLMNRFEKKRIRLLCEHDWIFDREAAYKKMGYSSLCSKKELIVLKAYRQKLRVLSDEIKCIKDFFNINWPKLEG